MSAFINYLISFLIIILQFMTFIYQRKMSNADPIQIDDVINDLLKLSTDIRNKVNKKTPIWKEQLRFNNKRL